MSQGAGVRAQSGERTGYAHTDDLSLPNLEEAARQARAIADRAGDLRGGRGGPRRARRTTSTRWPSRRSRPTSTARSSCSARWTRRRAPLDPRVRQVIATLGSEDVVVMIATPSGWTVGDVRPLDPAQRHGASPRTDGKREIGSFGGGGRVALRLLPRGRALEALRARGGAPGDLKLDAVDAPAGDDDGGARARAGRASCCTRRSATASRATSTARAPPPSPGGSARRSPPSSCTVVDDGTIAEPARLAQRGRRGHADAAAPCSSRTASCAATCRTGSTRGSWAWRPPATAGASRYAHPPMPRMTNTFMLAGQDDPEDIIRSVPNAASTR